MKKWIVSLSTIFVTIILTMALVACSPKIDSPIATVIGENLPKITPKHKLKLGMSALEMYETGVNNYNDMDYVSGYQTGTVDTKAVGLNTTQSVISRRVKENSKSYLDNYTFSTEGIVEIKAMYELASDEKGMRMRKADKVSVDKGELVAKKWGVSQYYDKYEDLLVAMPNDPQRINMLTINASTVKKASRPEYDNKLKQYKFTLELDPVASTADYVALMKFMVTENGIKNPTISFTRLKLEIVMWDNGLIRSIKSSEGYDLSGKMIINIKGSSNSTMTTYYSYDKTEMPYNSVCKF